MGVHRDRLKCEDSSRYYKSITKKCWREIEKIEGHEAAAGGRGAVELASEQCTLYNLKTRKVQLYSSTRKLSASRFRLEPTENTRLLASLAVF
eukprot:scaffold4811_cov69-Phaeocystis_antarctica.AAC.6